MPGLLLSRYASVQYAPPLVGAYLDDYAVNGAWSYLSVNMNFGSAAADRTLVLVATWLTNVLRTVTSVKFGTNGFGGGGVNGTQRALATPYAGSDYIYAGIWSAVVPSGTSGYVEFLISGASAVGRPCWLTLYSVRGVSAVAGNADADAGSPLSINVPLTSGGFTVIGSAHAYSPSSGALSAPGGVTSDTQAFDNERMVHGYQTAVVTGTVPISATYGGAFSPITSICAACFS